MEPEKQKKIINGIVAVVIFCIIAMAGIAALTPKNSGTGNFTLSLVSPSDGRDLFPEKAYPEYANDYSVEYHPAYKVVRIHDPWGRASENRTYLLVQRGEPVPDGYPDARVFFIPVTSVVTLSVTEVPFISALNETAAIKGNSGNNLVLDESFLSRAAQGEIVEVGSGTMSMNSQLQMEKIIDLEPDVVFTSATGTPEYDNQQKLVEAGLRPVIDAGWMEDNPLARAEWIKYYALFFNREKEANAVFSGIKANYTAVKEKAAQVSSKPAIMSGMVYQGTWYAPGGSSYVAQLFRDAGGNYLFSRETSAGDIPLDFEAVYERAHNADYYINVGAIGGTEDLLAQDARYAKFDAVKNGAVYHFDARMNSNGSLDYWQSGQLHPDVILEDLVKILHPDLVPDHGLYYYRHVNTSLSGGSP